MIAKVEFEAFMSERQRPLLRFAMVLTGDGRLAEEIVSDVLCRAWEKWDRIGTVDEPNAYVRRMIVNEFLATKRRLRRTTPRSDLRELIDAGDNRGPDHASTHSERDHLITALTRLPRKQRAALVLRFYEGLSDAEIATVMGCGQATVRSNASRALAALRIQLETETETETASTIAAPMALVIGEL
jgi:RNA polymerase sigma-70 factor (sigma-E family)